MTFTNMSIKQLSQMLASRSTSALDIQKHFSARLDSAKMLNAFITETRTFCWEQAAESNERYSTGQAFSALDGLPVAIKDNFCTKDVRTTCGSNMLKSFVPTYNSTVYQRLVDSGCTLVGKTNLDEYGMGSGTVDSFAGPTKNPWSKSLNHITGGSSGGSAAAVASGCCVAAIGSDTGGSVRNPASYCGLVGLKPSYGLVSRHGLIPLANTMDVPGILTKRVEDCLAIFNAIAGPDDKDATTVKRPFIPITLDEDISLNGIRVGIPIEYHCEGLDEEVLNAWRIISNAMEDSGAIVDQLSLPNIKYSVFIYSILNQCEVSSNLARYDGIEFGYRHSGETRSTEELYEKSRAESFNDVVKNRILSGNYFLLRQNYELYFQKAMKVRRQVFDDFERAFKRFDVLLTPTTLTTAPLYEDFVQSSNRDQSAVQDYFTQPANLAGVPAITVPIKTSTKTGMPFGLQLIAAHSREDTLFKVAKWIEEVVEFRHLD